MVDDDPGRLLRAGRPAGDPHPARLERAQRGVQARVGPQVEGDVVLVEADQLAPPVDVRPGPGVQRTQLAGPVGGQRLGVERLHPAQLAGDVADGRHEEPVRVAERALREDHRLHGRSA